MAPSQIKLAQNWPKAGVLDILDGNKSSYAHRAFASGAKGRPFESARAYHKINNLQTIPENRVRRRYALPKNPQPNRVRSNFIGPCLSRTCFAGPPASARVPAGSFPAGPFAAAADRPLAECT